MELLNNYRIAIIFTKCELIELWIHHKQPKLIAKRFPQLEDILDKWQNKPFVDVEYFSCSAFGMMGSYPARPNVIRQYSNDEASVYVIKTPDLWQPFGLIEPIAWLLTGKKLSRN